MTPKNGAPFNIDLIRQQIRNLLLAYPELEQDEILRADMIEGATDTFEVLRRIERRRRDADTMATACALTIQSLEVRQQNFERRERAMRQLAFTIMQDADLHKIELPEATMSIRDGTPKVIITDETMLPEMYWRIKREPNKVKLKDDLSSGYSIAGAQLSNSEPILTIRTR